MKLSPHFSLDELTKSREAARLKIDNSTTDPAIIESLRNVCQYILEPVHEQFGIPFAPNSGYRCLELNRAIGSKDSSQHTKGQAVDFELPGISNYDLACWVRDNLNFDQLILEFYEPGKPASGWVHCSYVDPEKNRNKCLTINRFGTKNELIK